MMVGEDLSEVPAARILQAMAEVTDNWATVATRLDALIASSGPSGPGTSTILQDIDQLRQGLFVASRLLTDLAAALPDSADTRIDRDDIGADIVPVHIRKACLGYGTTSHINGVADLF